jgi:hypothetical protein
MSDEPHAQLARTMALALADDSAGERRGVLALDDLAALIPKLPRAVVAERRSDVIACWRLRDRHAPADLVALLRELDGPADSVARAADEWAMDAFAEGARAVPQPPSGLGWEELGAWYARAAAMALPDRDLGIGEHALDLVRAVCAALLADDLERAGQLLRWLAVAPTTCDRDAASALRTALESTGARVEQAFPVLAAHRLWQTRKIVEVATTVKAAPAPASQAHQPAQIIEPAIAWFVRRCDELATAERSMRAVRTLGELGVLADQLLRHGPAQNKPHWTAAGESMMQLAWDRLDRGEILAELVETQPAMAIGVTVYWLFHLHGHRNERLAQAIARNAHHVPQPLAYLAACAMREIGLTPPWTVEQAYAWSVVGRGVPPWRLSPIEVYLVTHVAFYSSRFGERHQPFAGRDYLRRWLPVWLRHYEKIGAYDLLAEMIFTWHCVEDECCPQRAWDALVTAQRPDGSIPFSRDVEGDDYHSSLMTITALLQCRHN